MVTDDGNDNTTKGTPMMTMTVRTIHTFIHMVMTPTTTTTIRMTIMMTRMTTMMTTKTMTTTMKNIQIPKSLAV